MPNDNIEGDEQPKMIHVIDVVNDPFTEEPPAHIECGDIIEFK
ncbi:unnamed protein product, partial [Rotaria sp. Silwood1]